MRKEELKHLWHGFWQLADPKIWIASTVPMVVGAAMAFNITGQFNLYWFLWCLIGIYFIEIGKNAVNEVVDYVSGVDRFVAPGNRTPFSGGKKTIIDGKLTVTEAAIIAVLTLTAGGAVGLYITISAEPKVFLVGVVGFFLAIFYSLPPLKLAYRGLGELTVGLSFGPLIVIGTYLVQAHTISLPVILISLPIGFLIANVLWINQYPDYEADKKGNKRNWVVRLGRRRGVKIYTILFIASYTLFLVVMVVFKSLIWLLPLVSLPIAYQAIIIARKHYNNIPQLLQANAKTIQVYQLTGLTMTLAAILDRLFT
ncbi:1,4-dihydroxy-2-naphthoate octaprenyltransferase [Anoxybacter fermentans]|uniref:1,4-dihydroxy-2-naphthoate octaprenyltransferase n=1 Tax=Anoxybacter fermentans TaxID=1323375 RepID=A0A3S9SVF9_9FIRM|nr:prenyltransferase [Anoxybacter fermentans]AZR72265.1 1,4-dihydroxy-2-naphthoate octaprenyltransferase [Anoxybacter fermentans]